MRSSVEPNEFAAEVYILRICRGIIFSFGSGRVSARKQRKMGRHGKVLTQGIAPAWRDFLFSRRDFYFASSFFLIRRSSIKQSPEVVQRTQPIMMITFMSIGAGSCPACALQLHRTYTLLRSTLSERYSKSPAVDVAILVS